MTRRRHLQQFYSLGQYYGFSDVSSKIQSYIAKYRTSKAWVIRRICRTKALRVHYTCISSLQQAFYRSPARECLSAWRGRQSLVVVLEASTSFNSRCSTIGSTAKDHGLHTLSNPHERSPIHDLQPGRGGARSSAVGSRIEAWVGLDWV